MQSHHNRLILSVAGSGKTTYIVKQALEVKNNQVLITTYTEANEKEIRSKFIEINGTIPGNVTIQTWFSFLIQHGAKPFQGTLLEEKINGMVLVNKASGIKYKNKAGVGIGYSEESDFIKHYFTSCNKLYSDKLSKFVIRCDEKSNGAVVNRISRIYGHVFIDEVQDLAGHDLELLRLLFKSGSQIMLVGDPRQVTYLTHNEKKNSGYKNGNIKQYILDKCSKICDVDETTLVYSHRNNASICKVSSALYPDYTESFPCTCDTCRSDVPEHTGVYLVRQEDLQAYLLKYKPTVLRYSMAVEPQWNYGNCKGLGFERVMIYPTASIIKYLKDGILVKQVKGKAKASFDLAKFYVAITRARHSVAIVCDYAEETYLDGFVKWLDNTK